MPVRLGAVNPQTQWVLEQAQLREPHYLEHIDLSVSDVMQRQFYAAPLDEAVREVGLTMAAERLDLVPILNPDRSARGRCHRAGARPPLHP